MPLVIGAFKTRETADRAVDDLIAGGFAADRISVHTRAGKTPDIAVDLSDENRDWDEPGATNEKARRIGVTTVGVLGGPPGLPAGRETATGFGVALLGYLSAEDASPHETRHYADRVHTHGDYLVAVQVDTVDNVHAETVLAVAGAEMPIRHSASSPWPIGEPKPDPRFVPEP